MRTVAGSPWAVMLRHAAIPAVVVLAAVAALAGAIGGAGAAGSAAIAGAGVLAPFAATGLILWVSSRVSMYAPPLAMVSSYVVMVLLGAVLLAVVQVPGWIRPGWVLLAAVAQVVVWLAGTAVGLRRARLPVYDLPETGRTAEKAASAPSSATAAGRDSARRSTEEERS